MQKDSGRGMVPQTSGKDFGCDEHEEYEAKVSGELAEMIEKVECDLGLFVVFFVVDVGNQRAEQTDFHDEIGQKDHPTTSNSKN